VGNEFLEGDLGGPSNDPFTQMDVSSEAERIGAEETERLKESGELTHSGLTPGQPGIESSSIGIGSSTAMNAPIGSTNNPLFGYGSVSGRRYFNDGTGWKPIGQAPANVRWHERSGTGNAMASATTQAYLAAGGEPGAPNTTGNTSERGRDIFYGGKYRGTIDEEGNVSPVLRERYNPRTAIQWPTLRQGDITLAPGMGAVNNTNFINQQLHTVPGYAAALEEYKRRQDQTRNPVGDVMDSIPGG
jgi:hypothetical protein